MPLTGLLGAAVAVGRLLLSPKGRATASPRSALEDRGAFHECAQHGMPMPCNSLLTCVKCCGAGASSSSSPNDKQRAGRVLLPALNDAARRSNTSSKWDPAIPETSKYLQLPEDKAGNARLKQEDLNPKLRERISEVPALTKFEVRA